MPYIEDVWGELLADVKAEFSEVNAIFRYTQMKRRNWSDLIKAADAGGSEQNLPWAIVAFGGEAHDPDGPITSVSAKLPCSVIYVVRAGAQQNIDLYVEEKLRSFRNRLINATRTTWQFPLDGSTGTLHFAGTDPTGMVLHANNEPAYAGALDFEMVVGEIAPVGT